MSDNQNAARPTTGKGRDMKLKILACRQVYAARNTRGDPYELYEIDAENQQGQPIEHKLRSFVALPTGQLVDVHVAPFDSEQYGRSFTVTLKGRRSGSSHEQINALTERIEKLEALVARQGEAIHALTAVRLTSEPKPNDDKGNGW